MLGVAAELLGRSEEAARAFEAAVSLGESLGMRPELACARLDFARFLASRAEHDRAIEQTLAGLTLFTELGDSKQREAAAALLRKLGHEDQDATFESQPASKKVVLNTREADLLRRVARGQTDAAIAEELISNPSIIAADVRSLLSSIGVDRRSAAVAYAYEHGLLARDAVSGQVPLTILVTDLGGFTEMVERLGDADAQGVIRIHNGILRSCLRCHRGVEVTHTGDGIIASFVTATDALHCAVDMQCELAAHNTAHPDSPLGVRVGISAGTPRIEEDRLFGTAINAAVRICGHARTGQILVSDAVVDGLGEGLRFSHFGEVALKGFPQTVCLHDVFWKPPQGD
jgi:class 3 adenylate cyclase